MMKHVVLEGDLGERYGSSWKMKARSYSDIFDCIECNYPGFREAVIEKVYAGSDFAIQAGSDFISEEELRQPLSADTIIITEIPAGAKSGGAKILIGAALLAAVFFLPILAPAAGAAAGATTAGATGAAAAATATGGTTLAAAAAAGGVGSTAAFAANAAIGLGLNLVLFGLQQMLAPDPSVDDNDQNYLFDGPEQTAIAGAPVPYLFGRKIIPGVPINSAIIVGALPNEAGYYNWPRGSGVGGHIDLNLTFNSSAININRQIKNLTGVYGDII